MPCFSAVCAVAGTVGDTESFDSIFCSSLGGSIGFLFRWKRLVILIDVVDDICVLCRHALGVVLGKMKVRPGFLQKHK
jgi:hypothetical protein